MILPALGFLLAFAGEVVVFSAAGGVRCSRIVVFNTFITEVALRIGTLKSGEDMMLVGVFFGLFKVC